METNNLVMRLLQYQELDDAIRVGQKFFDEGFLIGKLKPEVFKTNWTNIILNSTGGIIGAYRGSKLIGIMGFVIANDPNDGELTSQEMFWFVDPEYRKGEGLKLLSAYEAIAAKIGVKRMSIAHLLSDNNQTLNKLYVKKGYRPMETHYVKEIS
jgi:hypothetical protein